jgi:hypothetical protein
VQIFTWQQYPNCTAALFCLFLSFVSGANLCIRSKYTCPESLYMPTLRHTTCLFNTADVRSSANSAPFCAPQRLRSSDMSPAQAPGNSRLLLLQHGAVRHGSSSLLLLPWALMSYVWSLELDRECEPHRWSSSSTLCRVNNSTCFQGRRHTNQGML